MSNLVDITTEAAFNEAKAKGNTMILFFWADWHAPCKQMSAVLEELAKDTPALTFLRIEAENLTDVSENYPVESVPTFVAVKGEKTLEVLAGASAPKLVALVSKYAKMAGQAAGPAGGKQAPKVEEEDINVRLGKLVKAAPVMIFIKGSPDAPRCGFSRTLVGILKEEGVKYGFFDILSDEDVRQNLKKFSNWPTYPQMYVKGELIGGLDVIKEMKEEGELSAIFPKATASGGNLNDRLKALVNSKPVMLFMKGKPSAPQCGFSTKMVSLLGEAGFKEFGHFNILEDDEVRQGLKKYSNWATYPQLYVKGELQGGLDVCQEMFESGDLAELAAE